MQSEVARLIGVERSFYVHLENGELDCWSRETVDKLAELFRVPVQDLLDDYNRFLYDGQGQAITALRHKCGMSKRAFAGYLGVHRFQLQQWESGVKRVSRGSWKKYFRFG